MSACYFWKNGEVVVIRKQLISKDFENKAMSDFFLCPCVDDFLDDTGGRYGHWRAPSLGWSIANWETIPPEELPKEFRMHLLLMGVS